jgi:predicted methyltransferase
MELEKLENKNPECRSLKEKLVGGKAKALIIEGDCWEKIKDLDSETIDTISFEIDKDMIEKSCTARFGGQK